MNCIAAISTPLNTGGVAMIRISGDDALEVAKRVFSPKYPCNLVDTMEGYTAAYGFIEDEGEKLDDGILLVYKAPHSYTGENTAEITCHGGVYIAKRILQACIKAGASLASPGEFTKRALLNGKLSLTEAESVIDIINAGSEQMLKSARAQTDGALYRRIEGLCEKLLSVGAEISVWIDYPDESEDEDKISCDSWRERIEEISLDMESLLSSYDTGVIMREGITVAIAGTPNAGKSTLMNLLSGTEKSIVTDIEGTTRDIVEQSVSLGDIRLNLSDLAGIRKTEDRVEKIGVEKSISRLDTSQLILAMFDGSRALSDEDKALIEMLSGKNVIPVINKTDLDITIEKDYIKNHLGDYVEISAKNITGVEELKEAVITHCKIKKLSPESGFLANERQRECAIRAYEHIRAALYALSVGMTADVAGLEAEAALQCLYELSGKSASEEVIDSIFQRFCVGK